MVTRANRSIHIFLIDITASGLGVGSYPIEIAWMDLRQKDTARLVSHVLQPLPDWHDYWWDPEAEAKHGISRDDVAMFGLPAEEVATALNRSLAGQTVLSPNAEHDAWWLLRLFNSLSDAQSFRVAPLEERLSAPKTLSITGLKRPEDWWRARFTDYFTSAFQAA